MIVKITGAYLKYELEQEIVKVMSEEVAHRNYCKDIRYTVTPAKILGSIVIAANKKSYARSITKKVCKCSEQTCRRSKITYKGL